MIFHKTGKDVDELKQR